MKLKKVVIENFRGITFAAIDVDDFTTLVGRNNIGKSTILSAIRIALNTSHPTLDDWPNKACSEEPMRITCEFGDIQEWEKRKPAISQLMDGENLKIRMEGIWTEEGGTPAYKYYVHNEKITTPFDGVKITAARKDEFLSTVLAALDIKDAADYNQRLGEIEQYVIENHEDKVERSTGWHEKSFANSLQQAIPHVMYVPASFRIEEDLKVTSNTSPFSILFNKRLFPKVKVDDSYSEYIDKARLLSEKLKGQAKDGTCIEGLNAELETLSSTLNQIIDFDSKVKLTVGDIDIETAFRKAATLLIDEQLETSLVYQGSGVQRALAFALLEGNASVDAVVEGGQRTTIVLYEEPELYIHPHLMRRLKDTLHSRSETVEWQVICSTHSPFLIDIADKPQSVKLLRAGAGNTRLVSQLPANLYESSEDYDEKTFLRAVLDFHPTVCESLFAKRVVVVEGDTEVAVFSMIDELVTKLGVENSKYLDTTVVSAGGKWTIPAIVKVLAGLEIDYKVIHDTDRKELPEEELEELGNLHPYRANSKIAAVAKAGTVWQVDDTFEHVLWNRETEEAKKIKSSSKPFHSWKKVRAYIDGEVELDPACEATLKEIIEFAFC